MTPHLEVMSAATMAVPSIISLFWILSLENEARHYNSYCIAGYGCMMHFPFSCALHLYRAYGNNCNTRTMFFKWDVTMIHVHALAQSYAWNMELNYYHLWYHIGAFIYLWSCDPLKYPKVKLHIDLLAVFGVFLCSWELYYRDQTYYLIAVIGWLTAFTFYSTKMLGNSESSIVFHALLGIPQYYLMAGISLK